VYTKIGQAIAIIIKIPKEYFKEFQVIDAEEDNDYALNILILFEHLLLHFETNPEVSPNLPVAEA